MDIVNFITGFEDNLEAGISNALVKYLHIDRGTANWAAKAAMFIFF